LNSQANNSTPDPDYNQSAPNLGRPQQTFHDGEGAMLRKRLIKQFRQINANKLRRGLGRGRKLWLRRQTAHPTMEKRPVFVVGCNRSGTNMVCGAIGNSPHGWDFKESAFSVAFKGYYLREDWIIEWLIRRTPAPIVGFGSILDSQSARDMLNRFDGARAIWIYRRYQDVANSCARMQWVHSLKDYARWVANGELEKLGARGQHIGADTVQLFRDLYREDLSNEEGACLYWYMRNQLYFKLNLDSEPRALLIQYEDTVMNQERAFRRVFDFLGFPYDPSIVDGIFASSVGKHSLPGIDPAIQDACDALTVRLDAQYATTSDWDPEGQKNPAVH
jgi:hypothetical protein